MLRCRDRAGYTKNDPQIIFESINATGAQLRQIDNIRNYILMDLDIETQEKYYKNYWQKMEKEFGDNHFAEAMDVFMRRYLLVKNQPIPGSVYEAFKAYVEGKAGGKEKLEDVLHDLLTFTRYYHYMTVDGQEPDRELAEAFLAHRALPYGPAYPFLLQLYHDYAKKILSKDDFVKILRLVESYLFRRGVCSRPTNSHKSTFTNLCRKMTDSNFNRENYLESVKAAFLLMDGSRSFPADQEFSEKFPYHQIYFPAYRCYHWLYRYENYQRKEPLRRGDHNLSIEHIMPQTLTQEWQQALGEGWEAIHKELLHTPGNLTLTGYNSEYSNRSFAAKRNMENGFAESPLYLNRDLAKMEQWDREAILARAGKLLERALVIWPAPHLPEDVLANYR